MNQQRAKAGFGGAGPSSGGAGGAPPNLGSALGGGAGIFLLVAGGYLVNSALFNGAPHLLAKAAMAECPPCRTADDETFWLLGLQSMEDTARSSTPACMVFQRRSTPKEPT